MIDTLKLCLQNGNMEISKNANLTVVPSPLNMRTAEVGKERLLFRDVVGNKTNGQKAYYNGKNFNLTFDFKGTFLSVSLPRIYSGTHNYFLLTKEQTKEAIEKVEHGLVDEVGIKTRLSDAFLSRIDLAKNAELDHQTPYYFQVLKVTSDGKYMKKRDYGDTITFYNSRREVCLYDKINELKVVHGVDVSGLPSNVMRCELRLLRKGVISKEVGVSNVAELLESYDSFPSIYSNEIKSRVFHRREGQQIPKFKKSIVDEIESILEIKKRFGRQAWQKVKEIYGMRYFAERYTVEEYEAIIKEVMSSKTAKREVKKFREVFLVLDLFGQTNANSMDLMNELYEKLVA